MRIDHPLCLTERQPTRHPVQEPSMSLIDRTAPAHNVPGALMPVGSGHVIDEP